MRRDTATSCSGGTIAPKHSTGPKWLLVAVVIAFVVGSLHTLAARPARGATRQPTLSPRLSMVVSTGWLAEHLHDTDLVLLHVGTRDDYAAGHIPGAQYLPVSDVSTPPGDGLTLELPPVDRLKTVLEAVGVGDGARIVICFAGNQVVQATRLFFALDAVGLGDRTSILDGGLAAWQAEKRATTEEVRSPAKRTLTPRLRSVVVDFEWVTENGRKPSVAVLDARPPEQFSGAKPAGRPPRNGHIPGAINIPVSQLVSETFRWRAPGELAVLFERAGVEPGRRLVTYCNVGQQASALYFAARYLGYDVVLYDGSLEDWGARGGPVVRDSPATAPGALLRP